MPGISSPSLHDFQRGKPAPVSYVAHPLDFLGLAQGLTAGLLGIYTQVQRREEGIATATMSDY